MRIEFRDLDIFWLTCEKTSDRWTRIEQLLTKLEVRKSVKIDEGLTTPYTIGIAKNHIKALSLGKALGRPFLVIEDDVELNPNIIVPKDILIPDCDALYLGTSTFGRVYNRTYIQGCIVCDYKDGYFKPINMLGMHAIIYNSNSYIDHSISTLQSFINSNPIVHPDIGCDNSIAEELWKFNIKVLKTPIFYQKDGHTDGPSLKPLLPIC